MNWDTEACRQFWWFVAERHEMFRRRVIMRQPPPWTDDRTLQSVAFTNIYRELDRATRALIRSFPQDASNEDLLFNILKFRCFSLPETYWSLGGFGPAAYWDPGAAERTLLERRRLRLPVFTNAFMYTGSGAPGQDGKVLAMVRRLTDIRNNLAQFIEAVFGVQEMPPAHRFLCTIPGFGGFMSYEVLIDVTYTGRVSYGRDEWVFVGPGALKGLQELMGERGVRPSLRGASAAEAIRVLRDWQVEGFASAGVRMNGPRLTLESVEQALCEFAKYIRAKVDGWSKRKYDHSRARVDYSLWDDIPEAFKDKRQWVGGA